MPKFSEPTTPSRPPRRLVVGITGASGAIYAQRLIHALVSSGIETHLVVSPYGQRLLHDELGVERADFKTLIEGVFHPSQRSNTTGSGKVVMPLVVHPYRDVGSAIASGSFVHEGMVIIPCSSNTLAGVANGLADNLLHRAAAVTLKERRRLVLVHREMPVSLVEIRNMEKVTEAGGVICPASPGFYLLPKSIEEVADFVVGRVLDLLSIEHNLNIRWGESSAPVVKGTTSSL